eukprot:jgi/Mesvir1/14892/Mv05497-RA.1
MIFEQGRMIDAWDHTRRDAIPMRSRCYRSATLLAIAEVLTCLLLPWLAGASITNLSPLIGPYEGGTQVSMWCTACSTWTQNDNPTCTFGTATASPATFHTEASGELLSSNSSVALMAYNNIVFNTYYHDQITLAMYYQSELAALGLTTGAKILTISLLVSEKPGQAVSNMRVLAKLTNETSLQDAGASYLDSMTVVWGPSTIPRDDLTADEWYTFTLLPDIFSWDGVSNIIFGFHMDGSSYTTGGGVYLRQTGGSVVRLRVGRADSVAIYMENVGSPGRLGDALRLKLAFQSTDVKVVTCTTNAMGAGGKKAVVLTNPSTQVSYEFADKFYAFQPISISPTEGAEVGGTVVTISGTAFYDDGSGGIQCRFGSETSWGTLVGDGLVSCSTPAHAKGTVNVALSFDSGNSWSPTSAAALIKYSYTSPKGSTRVSSKFLGGSYRYPLCSVFISDHQLALVGFYANGRILRVTLEAEEDPAPMGDLADLDFTMTTPVIHSFTDAYYDESTKVAYFVGYQDMANPTIAFVVRLNCSAEIPVRLGYYYIDLDFWDAFDPESADKFLAFRYFTDVYVTNAGMLLYASYSRMLIMDATTGGSLTAYAVYGFPSMVSPAVLVRSHSVTVALQLDGAGSVMYVLLNDTTPAPDANQILEGVGGNDLAAIRSGQVWMLTPSVNVLLTLTLLEPGANYVFYCVPTNEVSQVSSMVSVHSEPFTCPDTAPPVFRANYPAALTPNTTCACGAPLKLLLKLNEPCTAYYIVMPAGVAPASMSGADVQSGSYAGMLDASSVSIAVADRLVVEDIYLDDVDLGEVVVFVAAEDALGNLMLLAKQTAVVDVPQDITLSGVAGIPYTRYIKVNLEGNPNADSFLAVASAVIYTMDGPIFVPTVFESDPPMWSYDELALYNQGMPPGFTNSPAWVIPMDPVFEGRIIGIANAPAYAIHEVTFSMLLSPGQELVVYFTATVDQNDVFAILVNADTESFPTFGGTEKFIYKATASGPHTVTLRLTKNAPGYNAGYDYVYIHWIQVRSDDRLPGMSDATVQSNPFKDTNYDGVGNTCWLSEEKAATSAYIIFDLGTVTYFLGLKLSFRDACGATQTPGPVTGISVEISKDTVTTVTAYDAADFTLALPQTTLTSPPGTGLLFHVDACPIFWPLNGTLDGYGGAPGASLLGEAVALSFLDPNLLADNAKFRSSAFMGRPVLEVFPGAFIRFPHGLSGLPRTEYTLVADLMVTGLSGDAALFNTGQDLDDRPDVTWKLSGEVGSMNYVSSLRDGAMHLSTSMWYRIVAAFRLEATSGKREAWVYANGADHSAFYCGLKNVTQALVITPGMSLGTTWYVDTVQYPHQVAWDAVSNSPDEAPGSNSWRGTGSPFDLPSQSGLSISVVLTQAAAISFYAKFEWDPASMSGDYQDDSLSVQIDGNEDQLISGMMANEWTMYLTADVPAGSHVLTFEWTRNIDTSVMYISAVTWWDGVQDTVCDADHHALGDALGLFADTSETDGKFGSFLVAGVALLGAYVPESAVGPIFGWSSPSSWTHSAGVYERLCTAPKVSAAYVSCSSLIANASDACNATLSLYSTGDAPTDGSVAVSDVCCEALELLEANGCLFTMTSTMIRMVLASDCDIQYTYDTSQSSGGGSGGSGPSTGNAPGSPPPSPSPGGLYTAPPPPGDFGEPEVDWESNPGILYAMAANTDESIIYASGQGIVVRFTMAALPAGGSMAAADRLVYDWDSISDASLMDDDCSTEDGEFHFTAITFMPSWAAGPFLFVGTSQGEAASCIVRVDLATYAYDKLYKNLVFRSIFHLVPDVEARFVYAATGEDLETTHLLKLVADSNTLQGANPLEPDEGNVHAAVIDPPLLYTFHLGMNENFTSGLVVKSLIAEISSISPSLGPTTGGTLVSIMGNSFVSRSDTSFECNVGGKAVTGTFLSSTTVTCLTPAGAFGARTFVASPVATIPTYNSFTYTYYTAGLVSSFSVSSVHYGTPQTVQVSGCGFFNNEGYLRCKFTNYDDEEYYQLATYSDFTDTIVCSSPSLTTWGSMYLEVSLNGIDYTSSQVPFTFVGPQYAVTVTARTVTSVASSASSSLGSYTIAVVDNEGATAAYDNVAVITASVDSGTLTGTLTATVTAGVATFTTLALTTPLNGVYTLTFSSPGLISATSSISVTTGSPVALSIVGTDSGSFTAAATVGLQITVAALDAGGNALGPLLAANTASVAVQASGGSLRASDGLSAVASKMMESGTASFDMLFLMPLVGTYTLIFSSSGLTSATYTFNITRGSATKVAVTVLPSTLTFPAASIVSVGSVTIGVQDGGGNAITDTGSARTVRASLTMPDGVTGVSLDGTDTITVDDTTGTVQFSDLSILTPRAGTYTIEFTSSDLSGASIRVTILTGPVFALSAAPVAGTLSLTGGLLVDVPDIRVTTVDAGENPLLAADTSSRVITASIDMSTSGATVIWAGAAMAPGGVLIVTGLQLSTPKAGSHKLTFSTPGLSSGAVEVTIVVGPAYAFKLTYGTSQTLVSQVTLSYAADATVAIEELTLSVVDAGGNIRTNDGARPLSLTPSAGLQLGGKLPSIVFNGVATFNEIVLTRPTSGTYTVTIADPTAALVLPATVALVISIGTAESMRMTVTGIGILPLTLTTPIATYPSDAAVTIPSVKLEALDPGGNALGSTDTTARVVSVAVETIPVSATTLSLGGTVLSVMSSGSVTFSDLKLLNPPVTAVKFTFTEQTGTLAAASFSVIIVAGVAKQLSVEAIPTAIPAGTIPSYASGVTTSLPTLRIKVLDGGGNVLGAADSINARTVAMTITNTANMGLNITTATSAAMANGAVDFTPVFASPKVASYSLVFATAGLTSATFPFKITYGYPASLVMATPSNGILSLGSAAQVVLSEVIVHIYDAGGNHHIEDAFRPVTMSSGGLSLTGSNESLALSGVVRFSGLIVNAPKSGSYAFVFSAGNLTTASMNVTVTKGVAVKLALKGLSAADTSSSPVRSYRSSSLLSLGTLEVQSVDGGGNTLGADETVSRTVTVSVTKLATLTETAAVLNGTLSATMAAGVVQFADLTLSKPKTGEYELTFRSTGLTSVALTIKIEQALEVVASIQLQISGSPPLAGSPESDAYANYLKALREAIAARAGVPLDSVEIISVRPLAASRRRRVMLAAAAPEGSPGNGSLPWDEQEEWGASGSPELVTGYYPREIGLGVGDGFDRVERPGTWLAGHPSGASSSLGGGMSFPLGEHQAQFGWQQEQARPEGRRELEMEGQEEAWWGQREERHHPTELQRQPQAQVQGQEEQQQLALKQQALESWKHRQHGGSQEQPARSPRHDSRRAQLLDINQYDVQYKVVFTVDDDNETGVVTASANFATSSNSTSLLDGSAFLSSTGSTVIGTGAASVVSLVEKLLVSKGTAQYASAAKVSLAALEVYVADGGDNSVAATDLVFRTVTLAVTFAISGAPVTLAAGSVTTRTMTGGRVSFSGLALDYPVAGTYTFTFSTAGLTNATQDIIVVLGPAAGLKLSTLRTTEYRSDTSVAMADIEVQVLDGGNNIKTDDVVRLIDLIWTPDPAATAPITMDGDLRATSQSGVATFKGLSLKNPPTGTHSLSFSTPGLATLSTSITITIGVAKSLMLFNATAASVTASLSLNRTAREAVALGDLVVRAYDAGSSFLGSLDTVRGVTVSINNGGKLAADSGLSEQLMKDGQVSFTNVRLVAPLMGDYVISIVDVQSILTAARINVRITQGVAVTLSLQGQASFASSYLSADRVALPSMTCLALDGGTNPVGTADTVSRGVTVESSLIAEGKLDGTLQGTMTNGQLAFGALALLAPRKGNFSIVFSTAGLKSAEYKFEVLTGPARSVVVATVGGAPLPAAGLSFRSDTTNPVGKVALQVLDAGGNLKDDAGFFMPVTLNAPALVSGKRDLVAQGGLVSFDDLVLNNPPVGRYNLTFVAELTGVRSAVLPVEVLVGAPKRMAVFLAGQMYREGEYLYLAAMEVTRVALAGEMVVRAFDAGGMFVGDSDAAKRVVHIRLASQGNPVDGILEGSTTLIMRNGTAPVDMGLQLKRPRVGLYALEFRDEDGTMAMASLPIVVTQGLSIVLGIVAVGNGTGGDGFGTLTVSAGSSVSLPRIQLSAFDGGENPVSSDALRRNVSVVVVYQWEKDAEDAARTPADEGAGLPGDDPGPGPMTGGPAPPPPPSGALGNDTFLVGAPPPAFLQRHRTLLSHRQRSLLQAPPPGSLTVPPGYPPPPGPDGAPSPPGSGGGGPVPPTPFDMEKYRDPVYLDFPEYELQGQLEKTMVNGSVVFDAGELYLERPRAGVFYVQFVSDNLTRAEMTVEIKPGAPSAIVPLCVLQGKDRPIQRVVSYVDDGAGGGGVSTRAVVELVSYKSSLRTASDNVNTITPLADDTLNVVLVDDVGNAVVSQLYSMRLSFVMQADAEGMPLNPASNIKAYSVTINNGREAIVPTGTEVSSQAPEKRTGIASFPDLVFEGVRNATYAAVFEVVGQSALSPLTVGGFRVQACDRDAGQINDGRSGCMCRKGWYQASANVETGRITCKPCVFGTYTESDDQDICVDCPVGMTTFHEGATSRLACVCEDNSYRKTDNCTLAPADCVLCLPCTDLRGALCDWTNRGDDTLRTVPEEMFVIAGYWRETNASTYFKECNNNACLFGPGTGQCAEGFKGPLCQVCEDGYGSSGITKCVPCGTTPGAVAKEWILIMLGPGGAVLIVVALVRNTLRSKGDSKNMVAVLGKIALGYLQMVPLASEFQVQWQGLMQDLFRIQGAIANAGGLEISAVDCRLHASYYAQFLFYACLPLLCMIIPFLIYAPRFLVRRYHLRMKQLRRWLSRGRGKGKGKPPRSDSRHVSIQDVPAHDDDDATSPDGPRTVALMATADDVPPTPAVIEDGSVRPALNQTVAGGGSDRSRPGTSDSAGDTASIIQLDMASRPGTGINGEMMATGGANPAAGTRALAAVPEKLVRLEGAGPVGETTEEDEAAALKAEVQRVMDGWTVSTIVLLFLIYPTVVREVFQIFKSEPFEFTDRLAADLTIDYNSKTHLKWMLLGAACVLAYGIGIPLGTIWLLWGHRKNLHSDPRLRKKFGFLTAGYERDCWYWEAFVMVRKAGLIFIIVFLAGKTFYQTFASVFLVEVALLLQLWKSPYVQERADNLEFMSLLVTSATMHGGLFYNGNPGKEASTAVTVVLMSANVALMLAFIFNITLEVSTFTRRKYNALLEKDTKLSRWLRDKEDLVRHITNTPRRRDIKDDYFARDDDDLDDEDEKHGSSGSKAKRRSRNSSGDGDGVLLLTNGLSTVAGGSKGPTHMREVVTVELLVCSRAEAAAIKASRKVTDGGHVRGASISVGKGEGSRPGSSEQGKGIAGASSVADDGIITLGANGQPVVTDPNGHAHDIMRPFINSPNAIPSPTPGASGYEPEDVDAAVASPLGRDGERAGDKGGAGAGAGKATAGPPHRLSGDYKDRKGKGPYGNGADEGDFVVVVQLSTKVVPEEGGHSGPLSKQSSFHAVRSSIRDGTKHLSVNTKVVPLGPGALAPYAAAGVPSPAYNVRSFGMLKEDLSMMSPMEGTTVMSGSFMWGADDLPSSPFAMTGTMSVGAGASANVRGTAKLFLATTSNERPYAHLSPEARAGMRRAAVVQRLREAGISVPEYQSAEARAERIQSIRQELNKAKNENLIP